MLLHLIDTHFLSTNKLHKIFNRNTVEVSAAAPKIYRKFLKDIIKKLRI